jgi:hypothetical protein
MGVELVRSIRPRPIFPARLGCEVETHRRLMPLLSGLQVTDVNGLDAYPVGLARLHAVVASKRQVPSREHRWRLQLFIRRREDASLQIPVAGLLAHIGHRHE